MISGKSAICNVLPNLRGGGAEKVALNLTNDWALRGFQVDLVLMQRDGELLEDVSPRVRLYDLDANRIRDALLSLVGYFRSQKPRVTLVHMWPLTSAAVIAWLLAGRPGKLFLCEHTSLSNHIQLDLEISVRAVQALLRLTYPLATGVIAVSSGVAKDLLELSGLSPHKIRVINNPVVALDLKPRFLNHQRVDRDPLWPSNSQYRLITVGSLKKSKNYRLLIEAFAIISADLEAGLVILGEGPERQKLEAFITKLGLSERIILAGFHPDPSRWLQAADLLVLSSDFEGLPTVLIEALAAGTPVVSTACPYGPDEILQNGEHGVLVPVGDREALADGIREALNRQWNAAALQQRALDFAIPKQSQEYLKLFGLDTFFDPSVQDHGRQSKGQIDG
jgi:glycosyltransferase involved in cell wall biosynthesis